jgi:hypothetical protein
MKYGTRGTLRPRKMAEDYTLEDGSSKLKKAVIWAVVTSIGVSLIFFKFVV